MEDVFRALADTSRRILLERLVAEDGQTLMRLCAGLPMTRQAVTKHLGVLEEARVIRTVWEGREKRHWLEAGCFQEVIRWLGRFEDRRASGRADAAAERPVMVASGAVVEAGAVAADQETRSISLCGLD